MAFENNKNNIFYENLSKQSVSAEIKESSRKFIVCKQIGYRKRHNSNCFKLMKMGFDDAVR